MWKRRETQGLDPYWQTLATYNAEVARGIVHTPEWVEEMDKRQRAWDRRNAPGASRPQPSLPNPGRD